MNAFHPFLGLAGLGGTELILVLFVIILLFGAKRLPDLARSLGRSLSEFKKGKEDLNKEIEAGRKEAALEADKAETPNKTS